ncbi:hypothetical protein G6F31_020324 [Rhizopus arrhizus]|nr:hypothetical protein G6F31_020324 [Rhizopus arrhizus]
MRVVPSRRKASAKARAWLAASWPVLARQARSLSMRSVSADPTSLTYQGDSQLVLSRWVCPSIRPGSSKAPPPSSTRASAAPSMAAPMWAMRPARTSTSTVSAGDTRTFFNNRSVMVCSAQAQAAGPSGRLRNPLGHQPCGGSIQKKRSPWRTMSATPSAPMR